MRPTGGDGGVRPGRAQVPWIDAAIRAGRPYAYQHKAPARHNAINLGATLVLIGLAVGLGALSRHVSPWWYVPLAGLGFGWIYFALFVLVVHEGSHNMYVLLRNRPLQRRLNNLAGWAVAPLFATHYGKHWERGHIEHHVRPMEPDDPQRSVATGKRLLGLVLGYLFVPGFLLIERTLLRKRRQGQSSGSAGVIVFFVLFWTTALTLASVYVGWPLAVALYLGVPVIAVFNLVKGGLEHGGAIAEEQSPFLRSRTSLFPLRQVLLPFNITLHFEHHLNFQVPWYDLPRYQRDLRAIVPREVQRDVFNTDVLAQLSGRLSGLGPAARAVSTPPPAET